MKKKKFKEMNKGKSIIKITKIAQKIIIKIIKLV